MEYKVIALSVGGRKNKIFKAGDKVADTDFPEGALDGLIKGGYIKSVEEKKEVKTEISINDVTKKDLIEALEGLGFVVGQKDSKEDLFEKWIALQ